MRDLLYTATGALCSRMTPSGIERLGRMLGWLFWYLLPARRTMAIATIQKRLQVSRTQATTIARASFRHSAQAFMDIFLIRQTGPGFMREKLDIPDALRNQLHEMLSQDRPFVIVTGHVGSWEILAGLRLLIPEKCCQVVVRLPKDKALGRLMLRLRSVGHLQVLPHRNAAKNVLRCLKNNGLATFLVDHNCSRDEAVFLPFLGKTAAVNMGPALLALRAKAVVIPIFLLRKGTAYTLELGESLDTTQLRGTRSDKVRHLAHFYTQAVEHVVKKYPEQWFWMHKRWKTRPVNE